MPMPINDSNELPCDFIDYLSLRLGVAPEEASSVLQKLLQTYEPQQRRQMNFCQRSKSNRSLDLR